MLSNISVQKKICYGAFSIACLLVILYLTFFIYNSYDKQYKKIEREGHDAQIVPIETVTVYGVLLKNTAPAGELIAKKLDPDSNRNDLFLLYLGTETKIIKLELAQNSQFTVNQYTPHDGSLGDLTAGIFVKAVYKPQSVFKTLYNNRPTTVIMPLQIEYSKDSPFPQMK